MWDEFLGGVRFSSFTTKERCGLTRKEGERKFSINQNLTVLLVFRRTLRIMIDANL